MKKTHKFPTIILLALFNIFLIQKRPVVENTYMICALINIPIVYIKRANLKSKIEFFIENLNKGAYNYV